MTVRLTRPLVRAALDRAVARKGVDYVYTEGLYPDDNYVYVNSDGTPGCIVGHVLIDLGVPADQFTGKMQGLFGAMEDVNISQFDVIKGALDIEFADKKVLNALIEAQDKQDNGHPWGFARDRAVAILDRVDEQT